MLTETVGQRIRRLRKGLPGRVGQDDLADRLGVHRNSVQAWEADTSKPGGENLVGLARALGVAPGYILDGGEGAYRQAVAEIAAIVARVTGEVGGLGGEVRETLDDPESGTRDVG